MGIKIKNLQTGEFEKFNIPALKGEKGEPGEIEPSEKVDYIGKQHSKLRDTMNANVDYIIKTAIGEFNYLDYEGQRITATNSIEGHAKSAIFKGQTLVNLIDYSSPLNANITKNNDTLTITSQTENAWFNSAYKLIGVTYEKKYRVMWDSLTYTHTDSHGAEQIIGIYSSDCNNNSKQVTIAYNRNDNSNYFEFTVPSNAKIENVTIRIHATTYSGKQGSTTTVKGLKVLEYQQEMENWDIPYFEGMQSVKMPALTTRNNLNLLDTNPNSWISTTNAVEIKHNIIVSPNKVYSFHNVRGAWVDIVAYNDRGDEISKIVSINGAIGTTKTVFTTPNDCASLKVILKLTTETTEPNRLKLRLFENETDLGYPPYSEVYKSNILTVNEDVTLRGINNKKDTLDYNSGIKTEMIGEMVLKGTENYTQWAVGTQTAEGMIGIYTRKNTIDATENNGAYILCDKLPIAYRTKLQNTTENSVIKGNGYIGIVMKANSVDEVKAWLRENPVTVQYGLATESIKTVDLSDNHVYSYKDVTHYDCSSAEGSLVPTLSVKVPTDTQLTIQEQKATTQTLLIKNMDLQQSIKEVQAMNLAFNTALYNSFNSIREEVEDIKKHVSTNENLEGSF